MTTQTQGKGKKKNKEVVKLSLDEFNNIDAPHGHSVVSLKMTGLDWAETMADYDQKVEQQIIVPTAPRAQRGPDVDIDSLPTEPPFRVELYNVPMAVEDKDIRERFFQGLDVIRIETQKSHTTVELGSRESLYEALCKDGYSLKNRTINVVLYGHSPPQNSYSDKYGGGGRGGNSYSDRYGDRDRQGGYGSARSGDRYGDRSGGYNNRDRDNYTGFSRGGYGGGQQRAGGSYGYQPRGGNFRENRSQYMPNSGEPDAEESTNWRSKPVEKLSPPSSSSYNNGSRQGYMHSRHEPSHYQQPPPSHQYQQESYHQSRYQPHNQSHYNSPYSNYNNQSNSRPLSSSSTEERPKLVLKPRKTPINTDDVSSVSRNVAIFGQAKPSSTPYQKMNEIEEKLKAVQLGDRKDKSENSEKTESQQSQQVQESQPEQQQQQ